MLNRMLYTNPFRKGFWWGVGASGFVWLFGKKLRPLAVQSARGLIKLDREVKGVVKHTSEGVSSIVMDAQVNRLKDKIGSMHLSNEQRKLIQKDIRKLSNQLTVLNEAVDES